MADFDFALNFVLDFEDAPRSYKETIDNNGGRVIAGINSKSFPEDEASIATLPVDQRPAAVSRFYDNKFWTPMRLSMLDAGQLATRVFDYAVNAGIGTSAAALQIAVNQVAGHPIVTVDSICGPDTVDAANNLPEDQLMSAFRTQREAHYRDIVASNPAYAKYLDGWLARASA